MIRDVIARGFNANAKVGILPYTTNKILEFHEFLLFILQSLLQPKGSLSCGQVHLLWPNFGNFAICYSGYVATKSAQKEIHIPNWFVEYTLQCTAYFVSKQNVQ